MTIKPSLTTENYNQGFLMDESWMAGVSTHPDHPNTYVAFILDHTTEKYVTYEVFSDLNQALDKINQIERPWTFDSFNDCGDECGNQSCGSGDCCQNEACCSEEE